tara:strand:- start:22768 stop:23208 length:441 start_codon:yes stop_codon:yes gene_type:complete
MAANDNNLVITGNLTRDPELRFSQNGVAFASFSVAWNQSKRTADGGWDSVAHFFDVTAFDDVAEHVAASLTKGDRVTVTGRLTQDRWQDKTSGDNRSKVAVLADDVSVSLRWATVAITKAEKKTANGSSGAQGFDSPAVLVEEGPF